jgi:RNA polymerase sigma-32 factor
MVFTAGGLEGIQASADRFPRLERDEELELATRAKAGDRGARDRLIMSHVRAVLAVARGYRGYGLRESDLVEEGLVGLVEAVRRFEPERGLRFMTYASHWVRAMMLGFVLRQWSIVGIGTGPLESRLFFRLARERTRLGEHLTEAALARALDAPADRVAAMSARLSGRDASLDAPVFDDSSDRVLDHLVDDRVDVASAAAEHERDERVRNRLARVWPRLSPRERMIVERRLMQGEDGASLADLGRELGLSRERVRQLESRVKGKLRTALRDVHGSEAA